MKNKKGFTLIELLTVVVILALTFMFIAPKIVTLINEGNNTAKEIYEKRIIAAAKEYALSDNKNFLNTLVIEGDHRIIYCDDLVDAHLIDSKDIENIGGFVGVKVELLIDDEFEYTIVYENTETNYPIMLSGTTWYKSSKVDVTNIETIEFVKEYTPTGSELDSWNVDVGNTGLVKAYIVAPGYTVDELGTAQVVDNTDEKEVKLIITSNGSDRISLNTNSSYMFARLYDENNYPFVYKFVSLNKIEGLNYLDTSNVRDMSYMFDGCDASSLDLSNFNTAKVTNMEGMFYESTATTLDLSSFDTSNVTNMAYMFGNTWVTTLDLSNFDTGKVTDMAGMFAYSAATTLDLSGFDTSNVTDMYEMFAGSSAETLDLSSFDTSNVTDMSWMFIESGATSIDLSSFNTSNVTNMEKMFNNTMATTLDLSSFDTSNVTNMNGMFRYCEATTGYARTEEDASRFNNSGVTSIPSTLTFIVKP